MRRSVKRGMVVASLVVLAVLVVAGALGWARARELSDVGAGYVAHQMCSCMFVGGRSFESCRPDMLPGMERVRAEVLPDDGGVRAWVPLLAERVARHRPPTGCTLY